ncbi:predicted protein [Chaetoceros tenuissimus]|uniref:Uncharacterized protein n=1 Tax=Chaetoceros tenuissimus TaxID=426638 RepID=A0AAD3H9Y7_9STRA|nr:predicted protein [Chaetoceros tenuissimus]
MRISKSVCLALLASSANAFTQPKVSSSPHLGKANKASFSISSSPLISSNTNTALYSSASDQFNSLSTSNELYNLVTQKRWKKVKNYLDQIYTENKTKKIGLMWQDKLGYTALHHATFHDAPGNIIRSMIKYGGKDLILQTTKDGVTALHFACSAGDMPFDVFSYLVTTGGRKLVMEKDSGSRTALFCLCANINKHANARDKVRLLLETGDAEVLVATEGQDFKSKYYKTVFDIAKENGADVEILNILSSYSMEPMEDPRTNVQQNTRRTNAQQQQSQSYARDRTNPNSGINFSNQEPNQSVTTNRYASPGSTQSASRFASSSNYQTPGSSTTSSNRNNSNRYSSSNYQAPGSSTVSTNMNNSNRYTSNNMNMNTSSSKIRNEWDGGEGELEATIKRLEAERLQNMKQTQRSVEMERQQAQQLKNAKQMAMNAQTLEKQLQEKSRQIEQLHEARLAEQNERIAVAQTLAQRNHDLAESREKLVRLEMEADGMGRMARDVKRLQDENARLIKELEESKLEQGRTIARIETLKRKFNDEKNQNVSLTQKMQHLVGENASREDNLKREVLRLNNIIADQREKLLNAEKNKTVVNVQQPTSPQNSVDSWNSEPVNGESSSSTSSPSGAEASAQSISTNSSMVPVKRNTSSSAMTHITTIDAAMQEIGELEYEVDTLMEELEQEKVKHSETFNRLRETRAELREMKNLLSK